MRRLSILGISLAVLLASLAAPALPARAQALALTTPEVDYCTGAPDVFLGWWFNDACRGHDECLAPLAGIPAIPGRLACDRAFLADLLQAPHVLHGGACEDDGVCGRIAFLYFIVVRLASIFTNASMGG
ncbi:MAG: hypothetical protein Q8M79_06305 [Dehalococcoidia bacterium]|nr:hypothetical protein [Dehalococcoidia bacterium]